MGPSLAFYFSPASLEPRPDACPLPSHAAGSAGSLGLDVVLGVPVLPVDSAKFLTSILDNLATSTSLSSPLTLYPSSP